MIRNTSQTPADIPASAWTAAAVYARMGDRPFYIKRFAPGDERKTYVFFGETVLPLNLALPVMIRMHSTALVVGKTKERLYLALEDYFSPHEFEFLTSTPNKGFKPGEMVIVVRSPSGFVTGSKPAPDSYYGIREYIRARTEEGEKPLEQFMKALMAL